MCVDISTIRKSIVINGLCGYLAEGVSAKHTVETAAAREFSEMGGQPTYTWTYTSPDFSGPGRMNLGTAFAVEPGGEGPGH